jgi:hypothetical protein
MLQTQTNIAAGFTIKRREGASLRRQAATISKKGYPLGFLLGAGVTLFKTTFWY